MSSGAERRRQRETQGRLEMKSIAIAAIAASAGIASAQSISFDINAEAIDSGVIANIDFALGNILSIDSVVVEMSGTFASDLEIFLTSSDGPVFTILDGATGGSADLGLVANDSSLANVDAYTFVASGGSAFDDGGSGFIAGGTYNANAWQSGPFSAGSWNLFINDDFSFDPHSVGTVTINYTVPAPASAALLGLGGLVATRRRR